MDALPRDVLPWFDLGDRAGIPIVTLEPEPRPTLRDAVAPGAGRISVEEHFKRIRNGMRQPFPSMVRLLKKYQGQTLVIVGGGASLQDTFKTIRRDLRVSNKIKVLAPNKSHDFLLSKGFIPGKELHFGVLLDPMDWVATYQTPQRGVKYLLGSTIADVTWNRFIKAGSDGYVWHPYGGVKEPGTDLTEHQVAKNEFPNKEAIFIPGPSTVGLRSVCIGINLGFTHFELHGFDSCFTADRLYAYDKPRIDGTWKAFDVSWTQTAPDGDTMEFTANRMMARQVYEWIDLCKYIVKLADDGKITRPSFAVHGWGAIPWLAAKAGMHADPAVNAKYAIRGTS